MTPGSPGRSASNKPDFVGKRSLQRPAMSSPERKQLVGLLTRRSAARARGGRAGRGRARPPVPTRPVGHVTSSYYSAVLGRSIALALVAGGRARHRPDPVRADAAARSPLQVTSRCSTTRTGARSMRSLWLPARDRRWWRAPRTCCHLHRATCCGAGPAHAAAGGPSGSGTGRSLPRATGNRAACGSARTSGS